MFKVWDVCFFCLNFLTKGISRYKAYPVDKIAYFISTNQTLFKEKNTFLILFGFIIINSKTKGKAYH